jgi:hypothetical protein
MGKLGKMIAMTVSAGKPKDDSEGDDEDKPGEGENADEPAKLAMYEFRDAFNGGDLDEAVKAFKKLCDVAMDY